MTQDYNFAFWNLPMSKYTADELQQTDRQHLFLQESFCPLSITHTVTARETSHDHVTFWICRWQIQLSQQQLLIAALASPRHCGSHWCPLGVLRRHKKQTQVCIKWISCIFTHMNHAGNIQQHHWHPNPDLWTFRNVNLGSLAVLSSLVYNTTSAAPWWCCVWYKYTVRTGYTELQPRQWFMLNCLFDSLLWEPSKSVNEFTLSGKNVAF